MTDELTPCPWCRSSRVTVVSAVSQSAERFVRCEDCGAAGPNSGIDAENSWNTLAALSATEQAAELYEAHQIAQRDNDALLAQAAEIDRLRHHHCSNCGRRSEFISRCDPCLTKKLAGMERLIAEQATEIERLRAFLSRAVKDYQGDEWVPDAEAALAGGDA